MPASETAKAGCPRPASQQEGEAAKPKLKAACPKPPPPSFLACIAIARKELEDKQRQCRVCLVEGGSERMVTPCRCSGSQAFVHARCLRQWQESLHKENRPCHTCSVCKAPWALQYQYQAPFIERWWIKVRRPFRQPPIADRWPLTLTTCPLTPQAAAQDAKQVAGFGQVYNWFFGESWEDFRKRVPPEAGTLAAGRVSLMTLGQALWSWSLFWVGVYTFVALLLVPSMLDAVVLVPSPRHP
jgi:hypothetical protein